MMEEKVYVSWIHSDSWKFDYEHIHIFANTEKQMDIYESKTKQKPPGVWEKAYEYLESASGEKLVS